MKGRGGRSLWSRPGRLHRLAYVGETSNIERPTSNIEKNRETRKSERGKGLTSNVQNGEVDSVAITSGALMRTAGG